MHVYFQLVAFVTEHMLHKDMWMGHLMRFERIYTIEFEPYWMPHSHGILPHIFRDESNKLEKYMYERTKKNNS